MMGLDRKHDRAVCWTYGYFCGLLLISSLAGGCNTQSVEDKPALVFAGDASCASCHEDIYTSYHQTGMGRSVQPFDVSDAPERFDGETTVYNDRFDLYYDVFLRNDSLIQREYRLSSEGYVVHEREHGVDLVMGSGNATRTYLLNSNGYMYEMPVTWYVERGVWDMSPAYRQRNLRFDRPISAECMFCHNGPASHPPASVSFYEDVPMGITCERCHGAASDHVAAQLAGSADLSLVRLADLDRSLQLDVCQQCHLTGFSVFEAGEDMLTYQPGQPLSANRTVFGIAEELEDPDRFGISSHAERLAKSACYQDQSLTCTTCHDPHQSTKTFEVEAYNEACMACHSGETGSEPVCPVDPVPVAEAGCAGCHMPKGGTSDIPHVTFTDHWIRRTIPARREPDEVVRDPTVNKVLALVPIDSELDDGPQGRLMHSIALVKLYEEKHKRPEYLEMADAQITSALSRGAQHPEAYVALGKARLWLNRLDGAHEAFSTSVDLDPRDAQSWIWLSRSEGALGRSSAAIAALDSALVHAPRNVSAWIERGTLWADRGQWDRAVRDFERAIGLDPIGWPHAWNGLGFVMLSRSEPSKAVPFFEQATQLDPDYTKARSNLGSTYLLLGQEDEAATQFTEVIRQDPTVPEAWANLALISFEGGRVEEARELLQRGLAANPADARMRQLLQTWQGRN